MLSRTGRSPHYRVYKLRDTQLCQCSTAVHKLGLVSNVQLYRSDVRPEPPLPVLVLLVSPHPPLPSLSSSGCSSSELSRCAGTLTPALCSAASLYTSVTWCSWPDLSLHFYTLRLHLRQNIIEISYKILSRQSVSQSTFLSDLFSMKIMISKYFFSRRPGWLPSSPILTCHTCFQLRF